MSILKLMNARRNSGQQPTMQPIHLSAQEKQRAALGQCIQCGTDNADTSSYICAECQAKDTIDEIRDDIKALRQKILNRSDD